MVLGLVMAASGLFRPQLATAFQLHSAPRTPKSFVQCHGHMQSRRGTPIGIIDTMIAAHALATERTLVTNNSGPFRRISGLTLDNWR